MQKTKISYEAGKKSRKLSEFQRQCKVCGKKLTGYTFGEVCEDCFNKNQTTAAT